MVRLDDANRRRNFVLRTHATSQHHLPSLGKAEAVAASEGIYRVVSPGCRSISLRVETVISLSLAECNCSTVVFFWPDRGIVPRTLGGAYREFFPMLEV